MVRDTIPIDITLSEKYGPALKAQTKEEADAYLQLCIHHNLDVCEKDGVERTYDEAEQIEKDNIAYWAGYYSRDDMKRMEELYGAKHPVLGSYKDYNKMTTQEIFEAGAQWGKGKK